MNKAQEDLMDSKKYFLSPDRHGTKMPWKMMQSPFAKTEQADFNSGNSISIKSPKKFVPH
jgi:hypothetical protein